MKLQIAHVGDLDGMRFNIPDYQRGYRWETKQINELLDDLLEFDKSKAGAFYCLQPLVVVENDKLSSANKKVFDVIDGQQRLTTIFLIINYLNEDNVSFHLRYDRACDKNKVITFENGEIIYDNLKHLSEEQIKRNPDFFYLTRAIEDIDNWFKTQKSEKRIIKINRIIGDIIINTKYQASEIPFYETSSLIDINEEQQDVRFIWYDATDPTVDYKQSISVFKRLNYGKTSLTSAELIKALLFQCDVYDQACKAEKIQVAFRMSTEWDRMEKALQDRFMWSMLAPNDTDSVSHIDFILSYVASQLLKDNPIEVITDLTDDDYDYIVFNKYINYQLEKDQERDEADRKGYAGIVKELWQKIQDVFDVFTGWYKDRELYHLVGLRLALLNPRNKNRTKKDFSTYLKTLDEILEFYRDNSKSDFVRYLKKRIGDIINIDKNNKNLKEGEMPLTLKTLSYGDNDNDIVNILLVYNVTLCLKNSQDNQLFPFWFYRNIVPSLEHIHPQHLHDDEIDFETRCQWYKEKRIDLEYIPIEENKKKEIDSLIMILDTVLLLTPEEEKRTDEASSKSFNEKKKLYEANSVDYRSKLSIIDEYFDELATIDEKELHNISNLALVDTITNTILGNSLMAIKRQKLTELQILFNNSEGKEGAYTFAGTWKVFNKQFWRYDASDKEKLKASNLLFWSANDRKNYFIELETIYNEYTRWEK